MRRQSLIVLAIAVFLGLIAVYLVNTYLGAAEKRQQTAAVGLTKVAVALVPLAFGTPVTAERVRFVDWPADSVPVGAFRSIEELAPMGKAHVALRPIEVGEPIMKSKLSGEGGRASLSALLPPDMRAAAIRITDVAGVAGFVLPGDRVDVILTRPAGPASNEQVAGYLLQDIRVIAIDQDANDTGDKPQLGKTATLEVTPYDAQKLALAQTVGQLSLALRAVEAKAGENYSETVDAGDLVGGYGGASFSRAAYETAGSAPSYYPTPIRPRRPRRIAPPPMLRPVTASVEIVRGTTGTSYQVGRYKGGN
jgi:pilus assembly protein CpaB